MVKRNFEDIYSGLSTIPACDRQTDRQTDRHLATVYTRYAYELRSKNRHFYVPRPSFFVCPGDARWQSRKTLHE